MASLIHIAEIAAILAVAYMVGWLIGYVAHRLIAPKPLVVVSIPEARLAAATGADALVKAPVIAPVADPAVEPPIASPVPVEITAPAPVMPPEPAIEVVAPKAVTATSETELLVTEATPPPESAPPIALPANEPTASAPRPTGRSFRRFRPSSKPAPEAVVADAVPATFTATPATQPGVAWTGEIKGRRSVRAAASEAVAAPVAGEPPTAQPMVIAEPPSTSPPVAAATVAEPEIPPTTTPVPPVYDEDAAMRAIEGGWSRVKARALGDVPELSDLGAAVAAATTAVEQVLAKAGIDIDTTTVEERPKGLGRPRNGIKDDLKRIAGLGALDESTLNNLGVYHYEQISRWNAAQVAWMENHVFARGRIAREDWQAQARALIPPPS